MSLATSLATLASWPVRRWVAALVTGVGFTLVVAIPTALIETPWFGREVPPTWWAWPSLLLSSLLAGLLIASYVARPDGQARPDLTHPDSTESPESGDSAARRGWIGGVLTFFAVGCPVCNKVVLLALGSAGAMTWFEPVQPLLQLVAVGLLLWALNQRLRGETSCPTRPLAPTTDGETRG